MKKSCRGCKALYVGKYCITECNKGYDQDRGIPLEECPKPRTNKELCFTQHKNGKGPKEPK